MAPRFEHCRLEGNKIYYMGRRGLFEDKRDSPISEHAAWDHLEEDGWELVSVVINQDNQPVAYFKRPFEG
jgi:hypothetical protein